MNATDITTVDGIAGLLVSIVNSGRIEIVAMKRGRYTSVQLTVPETERFLTAIQEHLNLLETD